jgi:hypothetical protein
MERFKERFYKHPVAQKKKETTYKKAIIFYLKITYCAIENQF